MPNPTTPPPNLWILAATAILTNTTRREPRHDLLGGAPPGPEAENTAKTILANSWGVQDRTKLEQTIEWLGSRGHSADYQQAAAAFQQAQPAQRQGDPKLAFVGQFGSKIGNRALLAWDLGRLFALAGWGFLAGYCQEFEAWGVVLPAGDRLRAAYASWDEFAEHYRLGAQFAMPEAVGQIDQVIAHLRSASDSPWRTVPWQLGAAGAVPAPAPGPYGAPPAGGAPAYGPGPAAPPGQAPYGAPPTQASPGAAPYGPPPGAPGAMAPYGGAPMAPTGKPAGGGNKTLLFAGIGIGGLLLVTILGFTIYHFTHEPSHPAATHEHEHERPKGRH